jgi:hypothetical protein
MEKNNNSIEKNFVNDWREQLNKFKAKLNNDFSKFSYLKENVNNEENKNKEMKKEKNENDNSNNNKDNTEKTIFEIKKKYENIIKNISKKEEKIEVNKNLEIKENLKLIQNKFNNNFNDNSKINNNDNIKDNKENDNFFKNEECSPGAGAYEISKSIEKDFEKFQNKYKNNKVPFSSNTQRFYYDNVNKKNQMLENYTFDFYLPKEKKIIGGLINPIGINKKFNSQVLEKGANGPGQYMLDSFFDWNKKTYNIKYA